MVKRWLAAAMVTAVCGSEASAQTVSLHIGPSTVTLIARGTTLEQILGEWSRVGGLEVTVKGEGLSKAPVTQLLRDLTEREALDILLREVGGYVLVARQSPAVGRSAFDRILIVSTQGEAAPRARLDAAVVHAPQAGAPLMAGDNDANGVLSSFGASTPVRSASASVEAPEPVDEIQGAAGAATNVQEPAGAARSSEGGSAGTPASTVLQPQPPTPLMLPRTGPTAGNPFGVAAGSDRPGAVTPPGGPSAGTTYLPPVTNPGLEPKPFTPGGAP